MRAVATALVEDGGRLLLCQLATGPYAGFWLLPSAAVDDGTVMATARAMLPERTGCTAGEMELVSVVEEPKTGTLSLRFVFRAAVAEEGEKTDSEIVRTAWFTRAAVQELLAERDAVPNLGVMSLLRAWADGTELRPLELLDDEALCPCGSGYRFKGCCGWDAR